MQRFPKGCSKIVLRKEPNPAGLGGTSYYLSDPADWALLPKRAQRVVSPQLRQLFEGHERSLKDAANSHRLNDFSAFLAAAAQREAILEIHLSTYVTPSAALTLRDRQNGSKLSITGPKNPGPHVVEPLASLYHVVGGVYLQYMVSGSILAPSLTMSVEAFREQFSGSHDIPKDITQGWAFYEVDGDYLFHTATCETYWLGLEHYTGPPGVLGLSLSEALQHILTSILQEQKYHGE